MTHPVDSYVGDKIRLRRRLVGITQQQLGEKVGVKFQQIQKYETGTNRVSASRLWDIAEILDVTVSFFFEGLESDERKEDTSGLPIDILTDREAMEFLRSYYAIPEEQRRKLFDLAKVLSKTD